MSAAPAGDPAGSATREHESERVVVRDKRRLDPESGELRPAPDPEPADQPGGQQSESQSDQPGGQQGEPQSEQEPARPADPGVAELTEQLQRTAAEYANYRKRVERDRALVVELATAGFLEGLLPLLDSVELARQHGDLEGAFKGVGEGLEQLADRHGLERFGAPGDPFDPAVHHALTQAPPDPGATVTTVAQVLQPGWRLKSGRVLRAAGVAVAEPAAGSEAAASAVPEEASTDES